MSQKWQAGRRRRRSSRSSSSSSSSSNSSGSSSPNPLVTRFQVFIVRLCKMVFIIPAKGKIRQVYVKDVLKSATKDRTLSVVVGTKF